MNQQLRPERPLEPQRRAIVIGASSGIGAALMVELAQQGYLVAGLARRENELTKLADSINHTSDRGPRLLTYKHDVTDFAQIPALFQEVVSALGGLDLVIYNAGIMPHVAPEEYDFAKDQAQIEVNLLGAMAWLNQAAMRFHSSQSGTIVAISSVAGDRGRRLNPAYHVSKGGLSIYLESLRNRLAPAGVQVTTIKPGYVDTDMLTDTSGPIQAISPQKAATLILKAIRRRVQVAYIPGQWRWVMLVIRHIPSIIFRRLSI